LVNYVPNAVTREAGASEDEVRQTLLLLLQTAGFPTFMEAYAVYKNMKK
jgi:alkylhydroperoxidase/carboxymuconolactone decarboxylase family protein YurZ